MMSVGADILSWGLIILGAVSMLVGGIGVLRFPDVYSRMHAASITDTLGAGALLLGLTIQAGVTLVAVKLIMMLAFFFFTGPTSSFSLAHAALSSGVEPILDSDLREDSEKDPEIKEKLS